MNHTQGSSSSEGLGHVEGGTCAAEGGTGAAVGGTSAAKGDTGAAECCWLVPSACECFAKE